MNVWTTLKERAIATGRAFTVLAPMEDVTDTVFRQLVVQEGRPDVLMTEFTNCDGLASQGRERVIHRLSFTPEQHPIIAQVWGRKIDTYRQAVSLVAEMGFDGIDINMGCPVPKVVKNGAGSGLIKEPDLAREIILAVREAIAESVNPKLSLSVKTRIGFSSIQPDWVKHLLEQPIDALTLHLRTTKELSKVPAHWELMPEFVSMKDTINSNIVLIGNGDITSREQLATYKERYHVDGLMVGRGIFENLWLFTPEEIHKEARDRILLVKSHILLFQQTWGRQKNFEMIKKFFRIYLKNFDGAAQLRQSLLQLKTPESMLQCIDETLTDLA